LLRVELDRYGELSLTSGSAAELATKYKATKERRIKTRYPNEELMSERSLIEKKIPGSSDWIDRFKNWFTLPQNELIAIPLPTIVTSIFDSASVSSTALTRVPISSAKHKLNLHP